MHPFSLSRAARLLGFLALLSGLRLGAQVTILIDNADFEAGGLANDGYTNTPGAIPIDWNVVGTGLGLYYGYYNPDDAAYTGTTGGGTIGSMLGANAFYFGSAGDGQGIEQVLTDTFEADTDYALTVAVGTRKGGLASTAELTMQLVAGSTVIASQVVRNPNADSFADFTLNYDSAVAGATFSSAWGEALTVRFLENDSQFAGEMDIDHVRLTFTPVPEPSTWALLVTGSALACAGLWRRRGRHT